MLKTWTLLLGLLVCACVPRPLPTLPVKASHPLSVQTLGRTATPESLALSRDGSLLAWSAGKLELLDLSTGTRQTLEDSASDALCWSPDGHLLAAAFPRSENSLLVIFDSSGRRLRELHLSGRVRRLLWPATGQLSAGIFRVKRFSFGTHLEVRLQRWDEDWQEESLALFETTLTSSVAKLLGPRLDRTFVWDLSPFGDELLYTRIHAPPAFAPSRQLVLRHLGTGAERVIESLPLTTGSARLAAGGESMLIDAGRGRTRRQELWTSDSAWSMTGNLLDYNAATDLLLTDKGLYYSGQALLELPGVKFAVLGADGQDLILAWSQALYRLSGYPVTRVPEQDAEALEKLLKLRRLRSRELIDLREYQTARERVLR